MLKLFKLLFLCTIGLIVSNLDAATPQEHVRTIQGALLQTTISTSPFHKNGGHHDKIQPGSRMKLIAVVKNVGDQPSAPGSIFIRFALPIPLNREPNSTIFETENVALPSIPEGEQLTINFSTPHQWPSLFDFIRHDWAMREYEAVIKIGGKEQVTGTRAIAFSAYYYEGASHGKPAKVSTSDQVQVSPRL